MALANSTSEVDPAAGLGPETPPGQTPSAAEILKTSGVQDVLKRIEAEHQVDPLADEPAADDAAELDGGEELESGLDELGAGEADADLGAEVDPAATPTSWVTSGDEKLGQAYDLTPEQLAAFPSREEFARWTSVADRVRSRSAQPNPSETAATPAKPAVPVAEDPDQQEVNGKVNPAYFEKRKDEYTPETILSMSALRKQQDITEKLEEKYEAQQKRDADAKWMGYYDNLHDELDKEPELFGKTRNERGEIVRVSDADWARRQQVDAQIHTITGVLQAQGQPVPPLAVLKDMAKDMAKRLVPGFAETAAAAANKNKGAARQQQLERIAAQSRTRRPVASSVGAGRAHQNVPDADPHSAAAIVRSPQVQAVLKRIAESQGR